MLMYFEIYVKQMTFPFDGNYNPTIIIFIISYELALLTVQW